MSLNYCIRIYVCILLSGQGILACQSPRLDPAVSNIESIQAYTDLCWYGQKLTKVEVTYDDKVDLSNVASDSYVLLDRGYAHPDFAQATIVSVDIEGQVATLHITTDTEAQEDNTLHYIGDNEEGARTKNPIGLYATGPWYRAIDGTIYYRGEDTVSYKVDTTGDGYQTRPCLELKLYHVSETEADAVTLADEKGNYHADGPWLPTIDNGYGEDGFQTFETWGIKVPTTATDGDKFVKGWAYFPNDFDEKRSEKYPLIVAITGYGTSYWKHEDGTNNFGTGLNFDGSALRWMGNGAIVLNIHDRSHTGGDDYKFYEDDYNTIQYFIQNYNVDPQDITLTGNSRGTVACNTIAATYPGLINTLILNNGAMGVGIAGARMFRGVWTENDWQNAANNGLSIWVFDGEQDTDNTERYQQAISHYRVAGWSDDWIAENIRITGFPTNLYYYWGETDHSTTKLTYWYFFDQPYHGPDVKIEEGKLIYNSKLEPGETYQLKGRLVDGVYNKEGFSHEIYRENLKDWVLSRKYETRI